MVTNTSYQSSVVEEDDIFRAKTCSEECRIEAEEDAEMRRDGRKKQDVPLANANSNSPQPQPGLLQ